MELETDLSFSALGLDSDSPPSSQKTRRSSRGSGSKDTTIVDNDEDVEQQRQQFEKKWLKLGKGWQKRFLIGKCLPEGLKPPTAAAQQLASQPWVFGAKTGCGCVPCSKAENGTEWSLAKAGLVPNFRAWFLEKHQESRAHADAVRMMLGIGDDVPGAPALEEFEDMLKKLQGGASMRRALIVNE